MVRTRDYWLTVFLWRSLGASWGLLGASWGPLGALSGASWGPLGASWVPAPPTRPPTVWLNAPSVLFSFSVQLYSVLTNLNPLPLPLPSAPARGVKFSGGGSSRLLFGRPYGVSLTCLWKSGKCVGHSSKIDDSRRKKANLIFQNQ